MFERFTDRARRVVVLAQEESRSLRHNYIGTEHLLLGMAQEGGGVAGRALLSFDIDLEAIRGSVREIIGEGSEEPSGHIPFTPRAKKVLELSLRESLQLGHNYIGTEHILLGLVREGEGVAAHVLMQLGADLASMRRSVMALLAGPNPPEPMPGRSGAIPLPPIEQSAAEPGGVGFIGVSAPSPRLAIGLAAALSVLVALVATLVEQPADGWTRAGLLLLGGGVAAMVAASIGETLRARHDPEGLGAARWFTVAGVALLGSGAIALLLGVVFG